MQQKETSSLFEFYANMEIEDEKQKEKEVTESNEKPILKNGEEANEKISDQNMEYQNNKKGLIPSNNLIDMKTTKTSKIAETKTPNKKERKQLFLDSSIDLLNYILDEYEINERFFHINFDMLLRQYSYKEIKDFRLREIIAIIFPENIELLLSGIKKEMKTGNKIFGTLANFRFKRLYKYFKKNDDVILKGFNLFFLNGLFKTLKDFS